MKTNESMQIILEMIENAKTAYHRISPYFLIWGVLLVISGVAEYIVVYQLKNNMGFAVWPIMGVVGGIISAVLSSKQKNKHSIKTYYDLAYSYLWGGFGILLFLIILLSVMHEINPTPFVLLITGLPTFVTGGMLKSFSLKFGAAVFWLSGSIAFFIPASYTGLLFSLAIVLGYILPGLQLRKNEKLNIE